MARNTQLVGAADPAAVESEEDEDEDEAYPPRWLLKKEADGGCPEVMAGGRASRRRDCHFSDAPFPSILKHLLKLEGLQQNDSLADG